MLYVIGQVTNTHAYVYDSDDEIIELVTRSNIINAYNNGIEIYGMDDKVCKILEETDYSYHYFTYQTCTAMDWSGFRCNKDYDYLVDVDTKRKNICIYSQGYLYKIKDAYLIASNGKKACDITIGGDIECVGYLRAKESVLLSLGHICEFKDGYAMMWGERYKCGFKCTYNEAMRRLVI